MRDIRISIIVIVSLMIAVGVVFIYSSSGVYAKQELGSNIYFLERHLLFLFLGFFATCGIMIIDYRDLQKISK